MRTAAIALAAGAMAGLAPSLPAQLADLQPGRNFTAEANFGNHGAENIDTGDADLDGDLDVMVANGGKSSNAQLSRIYINSAIGTFSDETATRFAGLVAGHSRDVEFMDHDNDGDLDVFFANNFHSGTIGEVSRFFDNLGGQQAGGVGFFRDETDSRWGQLVSVPLADQVFGGNQGPFRDWSCDCDFGDIDDDGDIDLFAGSYGPQVNGTRDSRIFLNDGVGVFNELWPWANPTADVRLHLMDVDLADFDGDFDLDVIAASRDSQSRVYLNNLYGPLSASPFNDITQAALIATGASQGGSYTYAAEYGDVDADGDFDIWQLRLAGTSSSKDSLLRNDGPTTGGFAFTAVNAWIAGDPAVDENEIDFADYDNDGDLDAFLANFSGTNYLYHSGLAQGLSPTSLFHRTGVTSGQAPNPELPSNYNGGQSSDGEWADLDGDGDFDILLSNQLSEQNYLFRNILGLPDTHAPTFAQVTVPANQPNGSDTVIHAQVRDNGPYYLFNYYQAELFYTVNSGPPQTLVMFGQWGQQYRGVIPAQTDATVSFHIEVTDLAGNTGVSATASFEQGGPGVWTNLGFGLAGVSDVPSLLGTGPLTAGSAGTLGLSNAAPSAACMLFVSLAGTPTAFKCGTLVPVPVALQVLLFTNGAGAIPLAWASWPSGLSGASLDFQYAVADGAAVCGTSLSNALRANVP